MENSFGWLGPAPIFFPCERQAFGVGLLLK
jgi:hypothetical protein